jgi:hypothetical protein
MGVQQKDDVQLSVPLSGKCEEILTQMLSASAAT